MNAAFLSKKNLGCIFLGLFLSTHSAFAITINVPGDQPSIAAAVGAANSGDVIVIAPGTYTEPSVILIDKPLTITSQWHETGDEQFINRTVLDGVNKSHSLFETVDNFGVNVEISGLTFTRFAKPVVINDSAVIRQNFFTDNGSDAVSFEGTGYGYAGFNTIEDSGDDGIDVDAKEGTLTIEFNKIRNNGDDGVEVRLMTGSQPNMRYSIHDNIFSGNNEDGLQLIDYSGDSGRVFDIYNNVFDSNAMAGLGCMPGGNTTENFGGAGIVERVNFHNNTVLNNAVGVTGGDNFIALNNIVANNTTAGVKRLRADSVLAHSIFFNNGPHISDAITDTGNIFDVDPLYDPVTYRLLTGSPSIDSGVATFTWNGLTVLNLGSANFLGTAPDLGAKEFGGSAGEVNTAPKVNAGNDQVIFHPTDSLALVGQVSDDELPNPPGTVTSVWSQSEGPGMVTFDDASSVGTTATFPLQGKYQLRLTADDGGKSASDSVVVRYANSGNGNTVAVQSSGTSFFEAEDYAYLYGAAQKLNGDTDASGNAAIQIPDGSGTYAFSEHTLSVADQDVTFYVWIRGKGLDLDSDSVLVSFMDEPARQVTLSSDNSYSWFQVPGSFTTPAGSWPLVIRADEDGVIWDQVAFTTDPEFVPGRNQTHTLETRVSASEDDAEESAFGRLSLTSSDLELVFNDNNQTVGMRFSNVTIPQNATVTNAYVQFKVDEPNSVATSLTIQGQNTGNPAPFVSAVNNISSRAKTEAMVQWNPVPWTLTGEAGLDQQTPNIAAIIQELVNRPDWTDGNALAIIISGTGKRTAEAFNGDQAGAPLLHIEYTVNQAPLVNAGVDQSVTLPDSAG
ncbi:MAG: right-handed parallel beta-helix repeat-containing protein, partial [Methylobacter sp.]